METALTKLRRRTRIIRPQRIPDLWVVTMAEAETASMRRGRRSTSEDEVLLDRELADQPPELRWRNDLSGGLSASVKYKNNFVKNGMYEANSDQSIRK